MAGLLPLPHLGRPRTYHIEVDYQVWRVAAQLSNDLKIKTEHQHEERSKSGPASARLPRYVPEPIAALFYEMSCRAVKAANPSAIRADVFNDRVRRSWLMNASCCFLARLAPESQAVRCDCAEDIGGSSFG
jgi:hypothetical protein